MPTPLTRLMLLMKLIGQIQAHRADPEAALPAVENFVRIFPHDPRSPQLLAAFAAEIEDAPLRARLLRRLVNDYPDHEESPAARAELARIEEATEAIPLPRRHPPYAHPDRDTQGDEPFSAHYA